MSTNVVAAENQPNGSTNGVGHIVRVTARMTDAQKARDDGMERLRIRNRKWLVRAMDQVRELEESVEWTGEGIRMHVRELVGDPSHNNLWGVLVRDAIEKGLLERTGKWTNMELESSHARCNPVYRVTASKELKRQFKELDRILDMPPA